MAESPSDFDLVLTERQHLDDLFSKIGAALAADGTSREELIVLLDELKDYVLRHFAQEEDGGLFKKITSKAPRLEHEVALLQEQHISLVAALKDIAVSLNRESWDAQSSQEIARQLSDFTVQFREHEEAESRLLQEAYDRDVGSKD